MSKFFLSLFAALGLCSTAFGLESISTSGTTLNTVEPDTVTVVSSQTTRFGYQNHTYTVDFQSGWGLSNISGWYYVGTINGASAVYLGNGWVITCAHVLSLTDYTAKFTLGGTQVYTIEADSITRIGDSNTDLVMFRVNNAATISLPSLSLQTTDLNPSTSVVMIGYGDNNASTTTETYGIGTVGVTSGGGTTLSVQVSSGQISTDFCAVSNNVTLITGDSGGGAFYYNVNTGTWSLAGVLEAVASSSTNGTTTYYNYSVNIATYSDQIQQVRSVPEPAIWALASVGITLTLLMRHRVRSARI